ncbi:RCC1 domain-containing protein [Streptomyces rhizosphaerihabitans]|uniref:RCC1 domain-containing protein n=1 Tax=Streptomyces rhizosphaerihabitans TaxID=1266770 RepID=UPI0021BEC43E|nr:CAP domain-containing protein [Streptomyces rhizosphaerihabitans]MCT9011390.1 CAP domain-containing protein [Streptomyces rhizosphaerihabitans]
MTHIQRTGIFMACPGQDTPAKNQSQTDAEAAVVCLVNQQRALAQQSDGIYRPRLTLNPKLRDAARGHAEAAAKIQWWPAKGGEVDHVNPETGTHPADRIRAAGYCPGNDQPTVGEVAYDAYYTGPANKNTAPYAVVVGYPGQAFSWKISPLHWKNIIDPVYTEAGVAVVQGVAEKTDDNGNPIHADGGVIVVMTLGNCRKRELLGLGDAWAWGDNTVGQLGDGTKTERDRPVPVAAPPEQPAFGTMSAVCAGAGHSLALKPDGTVWAWGYNGKGQLGDGTTTDRLTPRQVKSLNGVVAVAVGYGHSLAVREDGSVWAWGENEHAQVGQGFPTVDMQAAPVQVPTGPHTGIAVAAGVRHSLALTQSGRVLAWGHNEGGLLGNQAVFDQDLASPDPLSLWHKDPVVVDKSSMVAIAAGSDHSLAIHSDGAVWAWGWNDRGQLGTGDKDHRLSPVQVSGLSKVVAVSGGGVHSLALVEGGSVWAWGNNDLGQLGDGGTADQLTPQQVPGLNGVVAIAAGQVHNLALKGDGSVWAWGGNLNGALGDGTSNNNRYVPVRVAHSTPMTAIAGGLWHSVGLSSPQ